MNNWLTVITFNYPHEAHIAKSFLESAGIEVRIQDELTAQVNNFYSGAIGGVKLEVQEEDYTEATKILVETGYLIEQKNTGNKFLLKLDNFTAKFPLIGKSIIEVRLLVLTTIVLILIIVPVSLKIWPSKAEILTKTGWCVDTFIFKGKRYYPSTIGIHFGCSEALRFNESGRVELPGFKSTQIVAEWKIENKKLVIFNSSYLNDVYEGAYDLEITQNSIRIESENTTIYGFPTW